MSGEGDLSLEEAIYTLRAMRRLSPEPVSEEDLRYVLDAATMAPNGENRQRWSFLVVTDPELKRRIGKIYAEAGSWGIGAALESGRLDGETQRVYRQALALARSLGDAPALILVCVQDRAPLDPLQAATYWGSIFPAVQNLMLAARARGLGTTLTTIHKAREADVKAVLGIPEEVETVALLPIGRPLGRWGRPKRRPSAEVTRWNRW